MPTDDQSNPKEPKLKLSFGPPNFIIPANVRSSRLLPRVISIAAIAVWLIVFYAGTTALMKREKESAYGSDAFLTTGTSYYGVFSGTNKQCLGILQTELDDTQLLHIDSKGTFRFKLGGLSSSVNMRIEAQFNDYNRLTQFSFEALVANGIIRALKTEGKNPQLLVTVDFEGKHQQRKFEFPDPIFLFEKHPGIYAMRLPAAISKQLESFTQQQNILGQALGLQATLISPAQVDRCRNTLQNASTTEATQGIEIGKYLRFMDFKLDEHLSENANDLASD